MTPAQEKFELLMQGIDRFLSAEGFHRSGKHFLKRMPDKKVRWNIWPQLSKWNTAERAEFTFAVYAEWKHRWARCEDWEPKTTWYGVIGNRIGNLMPKKQDTWWKLAGGTSIDFLSDQINGVMSSCALPFLKQFQTEQDIKIYLRPGPVDSYIHALAILELDLMEKKPSSEIEKNTNEARRLWRKNISVVESTAQSVLKVLKIFKLGTDEGINKGLPKSDEVVEAAIQRILKAYSHQSSSE